MTSHHQPSPDKPASPDKQPLSVAQPTSPETLVLPRTGFFPPVSEPWVEITCHHEVLLNPAFCATYLSPEITWVYLGLNQQKDKICLIFQNPRPEELQNGTPPGAIPVTHLPNASAYFEAAPILADILEANYHYNFPVSFAKIALDDSDTLVQMPVLELELGSKVQVQ